MPQKLTESEARSNLTNLTATFDKEGEEIQTENSGKADQRTAGVIIWRYCVFCCWEMESCVREICEKYSKRFKTDFDSNTLKAFAALYEVCSGNFEKDKKIN